ncbi:conserved hypothetical protein [Hyphomicrobiales bacterium]|nr:conserved hypothetical protein [Hyphomicrobiales bacterium]CAH1702106.1 conserved hypothetical protein [Hyphomicrobiales bacterium]CAI0346262.1 conserved hypothetical protein [Hyphomicrobiales bacterium]
MSDKVNDGGPAFPVVDQGMHGTYGISQRDYFAAQAMIGLLHPGWEANAGNQPELVARHAYALADAMLKARSNPEQAHG